MTSNSQTNSARRAGNIRLALDAMGNRTSATIASQGGGTFNYGNATPANQYTSITGRSAITHDANGSQLLNGAGATFTWDSENRLLTVTPVSPNLGDKAHVHSYDGLHRRVTRTTREWTSSGWTNLETTYFIYDGWNVIEEWTRTFSPATAATLTRRLTWGQDLAGSPSLQGAGGVGGLLMVEEITSTTTAAYHFHYDGNGNVTEITDHLGAPAATYRYDAFGNTLVATGTYSQTNRYRFSTKPLDHEVTTAPLYYYGYRHYDPLTGRWPSRDPIGERGGVNLYGFVGNDGVNWWDYLGLDVGRTNVTARYGDDIQHDSRETGMGLPVWILCSEKCDTSGIPAHEGTVARGFFDASANAEKILGRRLKEGETLYSWFPAKSFVSDNLSGTASALGHISDGPQLELLKDEARADLDKKYGALLEDYGLKDLPCEVLKPFSNRVDVDGAYVYDVRFTGDPRERPPVAPKPPGRPPGIAPPPPPNKIPVPENVPEIPPLNLPDGDFDF